MGTCLPVLQSTRCPFHLLEVWRRSQPSSSCCRWSLRYVFDYIWVQDERLGVEEGTEESCPPLENDILAPDQHAILVRYELLTPRLSPAEPHRSFEVYVQSSHVAVLVCLFDLRHIPLKVGHRCTL